jgi:superfamily I DNA/RNA helicase
MKPTKEQAEAINSTEPNLMISACPGSGKTATVVTRAARLARKGWKTAIISYTNAAADEITSRIDKALPDKDDRERVIASTIHRLTNTKRLRVIDTEFVHRVLIGSILRPYLKGKPTPRQIAEARTDPDTKPELAMIWERVAGLLDRSHAIDQDGLLIEYAKHHPSLPVDHLFLDEAQDCGPLTWEVFASTQNLTGNLHRLVVGDADQSIFGWIGADVESFDRFRQDSKVLTLSTNFRSSPAIVEFANSIMPKTDQVAAREYPNTPVEIREFDSDSAESRAVLDWTEQHDNAAILCRTNSARESYETLLKGAGVKVNSDSQARPRDWTKAKALIRALRDPQNDILGLVIADKIGRSCSTLMSTRRSTGTPIIQQILSVLSTPLQAAQTLLTVTPSLYEILATNREPCDALAAMTMAEREMEIPAVTDGVTVSTVHRAKGLEWDAVWIPGIDQRWSSFGPRSSFEEERRIFYVAATRARNSLTLSSINEGATIDRFIRK